MAISGEMKKRWQHYRNVGSSLYKCNSGLIPFLHQSVCRCLNVCHLLQPTSRGRQVFPGVFRSLLALTVLIGSV